MSFQFNARSVQPEQTPTPVPKAQYKLMISKSNMKANKNNDGGFIVIDCPILEGQFQGRTLQNRYNMWNKNPQAVEIAHKQFSALCHALNVLDVQSQDGAEDNYVPMLHNIPFLADVAVDGEYNRITKVYDVNGNEPGAVPSGPPQGQPQQPPQAPPQAPPQGQPPAQGGWGAPQGQPPQGVQPVQQAAWGAQPQQPPQQPQQGGFQPGAWGSDPNAQPQQPPAQPAPAQGQWGAPQGAPPAQPQGAPAGWGAQPGAPAQPPQQPGNPWGR